MSRSGVSLREMARGWRWGSRPLVPASAEEHLPLPPAPKEFPTEWARTPAARAVRSVAQAAALKPLIWSEVSPSVSGLHVLAGLKGPVIFAANHSSHLDAPLLLCALPPAWRRETLVAAAADYFFDAWWRAVGTALVFGTVPLDRSGGAPSSTPQDLLNEGWNLVVFPEGTRAPDGQQSSFKSGTARLAQASGALIVPVGVRGSYAAMPRGRGWPVPGRPRVRVRFGTPLRPRPNESARDLTTRLSEAITALVSEDESTWWESLRNRRPAVQLDAGAARWRRVWASTAPVESTARRTPWD